MVKTAEVIIIGGVVGCSIAYHLARTIQEKKDSKRKGRFMSKQEIARAKPALEVAELYPSQGEWSEEDYFNLPDTNRYVELSEGRLIVPPHPTNTHQAVLEELYVRLRAFVRERDLGVARIAPLPVRLWPGKIREPDILFVAKEHVDRIGEKVYGVPDLVMEVVSSSTRKMDQVDKFAEYAKAGVREYWMVDPEKGIIEVYALEEDAYILLGRHESGQTAGSKLLPDFKVSVDEVFA